MTPISMWESSIPPCALTVTSGSAMPIAKMIQTSYASRTDTTLSHQIAPEASEASVVPALSFTSWMVEWSKPTTCGRKAQSTKHGRNSCRTTQLKSRACTLKPELPSREQNKIKDASAFAQAAFWQVIADAFPDIESGDMPPLDANAFEAACDAAVQVWYETNKPFNMEDLITREVSDDSR